MKSLEETIAQYEEMSDRNKILYEVLIEGEMKERKKKCSEEYKQLTEWLKELKAYRNILANVDKLIESEYGVVIIEGYKDVVDQMSKIYKIEVDNERFEL